MKKILTIMSLIVATIMITGCKVRENEKPNTDNNVEEKKSSIEDYGIKYDSSKNKQKINVYFFWRDGCPYCAEAKEVFAKIEQTYGDCYTMKSYDIWDEEKPTNMDKFILASDYFKVPEDKRGVPLIVINNKQAYYSNEAALIKTIIDACQLDDYEDNFASVIEPKS